MTQIIEKLKAFLMEWNDSPKDFVIHMLIVLAVLTFWGFVMGGEYR